jgi:hypothetical protein
MKCKMVSIEIFLSFRLGGMYIIKSKKKRMIWYSDSMTDISDFQTMFSKYGVEKSLTAIQLF